MDMVAANGPILPAVMQLLAAGEEIATGNGGQGAFITHK